MQESKKEESRYLISETAKKVMVEPHVLRYWEEELHLPIHRNELGHRYYTKEDINRFRKIKELKEKGLQLRAIKNVLADEKNERILFFTQTTLHEKEDEKREEKTLATMEKHTVEPMVSKEEKAARLQMLLRHMICEAVRECNSEMAEEIKESIVKELDYQFRVWGEEEEKRGKEQLQNQEEHFKKMDELIRSAVQKKEKRIFSGKIRLGKKEKTGKKIFPDSRNSKK